MRTLCLAAALLAGGQDVAAQAPEARVALELVLAVDSSASVDDREFELQVEGIAQAFAHPEVLAAIESLGELDRKSVV